MFLNKYFQKKNLRNRTCHSVVGISCLVMRNVSALPLSQSFPLFSSLPSALPSALPLSSLLFIAVIFQ